MSQPTGRNPEVVKSGPGIKDPSEREEMDSILLLATRAVSRLGQPGAVMKEILQKLVQAAAEVDWRPQEAPKPVAAAAASASIKSCR